MQTIGSVIKNSPALQKRFAERREMLLNNEVVKYFIKQNEGLLTEEAIENSLSRINEFVIRQKDPHHEPKLIIYNGHIDVTYRQRDTPLLNKQAKGIRNSTEFDSATSEWRGLNMSDYNVDPYNSRAAGFVKSFVESYQYGKGITGMWLCGQKGTGKSFLMGCMTGELSNRNVGVTYVGAATFINDTMTSLTHYNENSNRVLNKYRKAEVLIIDDIGTEYLTEYIYTTILRDIIFYRQSNRLATFFTSNYTVNDYIRKITTAKGITEDMAKQFKTRIDALAVEVQIGGTDRRQKAKYPGE